MSDLTDFTDPSRPIRAGEELDLPRLSGWLVENLPELRPAAGAPPPAIAVEQFPSGHSNLTYLLRATVAGGEKEYVLRRPPVGSKVKSAHDMGREFRILSRLHAVYPAAPRPLAHCDDAAVLGAPFYVMERIRGVILRRTPPTGFDLSPDVARRLCESFVDNLAALHAIDFQAAGLADLGKPDGYVARQVSGWSKRYLDAKTDDIPEVERMSAWLAARIPSAAASGAALIHNDYKFDNLVLDGREPTRIIGVLDWEMSTLGDPLMDLGTALGYWVEPGDSDELKAVAFGPSCLPGMLSRRQLADRYGEKTGRSVANLDFYYCFALWKTAVVVQQIYYRYKQGLTSDPRFAAFIAAVRILSATAERAAAGHGV